MLLRRPKPLSEAEPFTEAELDQAEQVGLRQYRAALIVAWFTCGAWAVAAVAAGAVACAPLFAIVYGLPFTLTTRSQRRKWRASFEQRRAQLRAVPTGAVPAVEGRPAPFSEEELELSFKQARKWLYGALAAIWVLMGPVVWSYGASAVTVTLGVAWVLAATWLARRRLRWLDEQLEERREQLRAFLASAAPARSG